MSQHDQDLANQSGATFRSDVNSALGALFSSSSGATEPSVTVAYMWWADTTSGLLKQRNAANNAWISVARLADFALPSVQGQLATAFTTGGSSTAYTLTPTPALTALATGQEFDVTFHTAAGSAPTLAVSGLTAKNLKWRDSTGTKRAVTAVQVPSNWRSRVVYDGTDMQLQTGLGNAGGGTPAGSTTQIQYNNAGAFGGDAGMVFDSTAKMITMARNNSGGVGGRVRALNSNASLAVSDAASLEACIENSAAECAKVDRTLANIDTSGSGYWSRLYTLGNGGGGTVQNLISRKQDAQLQIGGDGGSWLGYITVYSGGVSRFANAAAAGLGLSPIVASPANLTGQTGDVAAYNLLASSHTAGTYRVCGALSVTTTLVASMSGWTLTWLDLASGSDVTNNIVWDNNGTLTATPSTATQTGISMVCKILNSAGTSAIQIDPGDVSTAAYTSAFTIERLK